jgi:purine-cytosine permease-like protein
MAMHLSDCQTLPVRGCAVVFGVVMVMTGIMGVRALQLGQWAVSAIIGVFFLVFAIQIGNYFRRNRPGRYRPEAIPRAVLPNA